MYFEFPQNYRQAAVPTTYIQIMVFHSNLLIKMSLSISIINLYLEW